MSDYVRLDKFLTEMNRGSRSQMKEAAKKGRICVNGEIEKKTDRKIKPDTDEVVIDGHLVAYTKFEYYMLYKPQGVVSATTDHLHQTVLDLMPVTARKDLFPVGRLDIDTEGFLLLTNDGDLAHRLLSPKKHVDKIYYAKIEGRLPDDTKIRFENGILLPDGTKTLPADLVITEQTMEGASILLTIREGKFHQVKRMFETVGCRVTFLKRLSMGQLQLDQNLKPGEYRRLTEEELNYVKRETGDHF